MQFNYCLNNCPLCDVLERQNFQDSPVMAKSPLSVKSYLQIYNPSPTEKFAFVIFLSFFVIQADGSGGGSIVGALDKIWTSLLELKR